MKIRKQYIFTALLAALLLVGCAGEKKNEEGSSEMTTNANNTILEELSEGGTQLEGTQSEGTQSEENQADAEASEVDWYEEMLEASVLSVGTNGRLERVLERMKQGEKISVAAIGGSVTEGAGADKIEESYMNRFFAYLQNTYSQADLTYVNAGLGGTPSALGVMRYERDVVEVLGDTPDILIVEFAVNDYNEVTKGRAYESLVRTALEADEKTAVILVFAVFQSQWNMQSDYIPVGKHYGLPMVSIRDAVKKPYADGNLTDKEFFFDEYHPTSYGHEIMADCISRMVQRLEKEGGASSVEALPEYNLKVLSFQGIQMLASDSEGVTLEKGGFSESDTQVQAFMRTGKNSFPNNWMHTEQTGNEAFHVELECKNILLNFKTSGSQEFGKAQIFIDGTQVAELDGHSDGGWNNSNVVLVLDEKESASHVLEIKMAEEDKNKKFTVLAIGYTK